VKKSCCTPARSPATCDVRNSAESATLKRVPGDPTGMRSLAGGPFLMGTDDSIGYPADGEGPVREVTLAPFAIDPTLVTNRQFRDFVNATGYKTEAQKFGWSFVFHLHVKRKHVSGTVRGLEWWSKVDGACWRHPEGPGSNIKKRLQHPATHISWNDANSYASWAGKRLPTEAEWEYAARGGLVQKRFVWGNELRPGGKHMCNIFQGDFPHRDTAEDGYSGSNPVKSYKANGYGLYDMAGNVWEWCADWFHASFHSEAGCENPTGPMDGDRKVIRGGSFLCHDSYCHRYRVGARTSNNCDSGASNQGFRCVRDLA
jgi:formylglycine-generating enzyme